MLFKKTSSVALLAAMLGAATIVFPLSLALPAQAAIDPRPANGRVGPDPNTPEGKTFYKEGQKSVAKARAKSKALSRLKQREFNKHFQSLKKAQEFKRHPSSGLRNRGFRGPRFSNIRGRIKKRSYHIRKSGRSYRLLRYRNQRIRRSFNLNRRNGYREFGRRYFHKRAFTRTRNFAPMRRFVPRYRFNGFNRHRNAFGHGVTYRNRAFQNRSFRHRGFTHRGFGGRSFSSGSFHRGGFSRSGGRRR